MPRQPALRLQSVNLESEIYANPYYAPGGDALSPRTFVNKIDVPTYMGGAFQDEQTGGEWSTMLSDFAPGTPLKVFMTNGTHVESLAGQDFTHLLEFLDFYVGQRIPKVNPLLLAIVPAVLPGIFGGAPIPIPQSKYATYTSYAAALAAYQAVPPIRLVWENGAGAAPGEPVGTGVSQFAAWPVPGTIASPLYLQPDGHLAATPDTVPDDAAPRLFELRLRPGVEAALDLRRLDRRHMDGRDPDEHERPLEPAHRGRLARAS